MLESFYSCWPEPLQFYQRETPTQAFSWEYCHFFKNSFFIERLWRLLLYHDISHEFYKIYLLFTHGMRQSRVTKAISRPVEMKKIRGGEGVGVGFGGG